VNSVCFFKNSDVDADFDTPNHLASGSADGRIMVWNLRSRSSVESFLAHDAPVLSLNLLPNEPEKFVTFGRDGFAKLWDLHNISDSPLASMMTGSHQFCNASTLDACSGRSNNITSVLATPSDNDGEILLWDLRSRERIRSINSEIIGIKVKSSGGSRGMVTCIKLSSRGFSSSSVTSPFTAEVCPNCEVETGEQQKKSASLLTQKLLLQEVSSSSSSFFPSAEAYIFAGYENGSLSIIDLRNFKHIAYIQPHSDPLMAFDVAPDFKSVITAGADKSIQRWGVQDRECHSSETAEGGFDINDNLLKLRDTATIPESGTSCVKYRCDGRIVVSGHWDKTIRVFDTKRLKPIAVLRHHRDSVFAIDFASPTNINQGMGGGGMFATGSKDGTVAIWDIFAETLPK